MTVQKQLSRCRRRAFEFLGVDLYSRPALNEIDRKLEAYLPHRNGFFIEAGANDGFVQSNTYYFEKIRGWRGILIEPIPELFRACVKERTRSAVYNCALVADGYGRTSITMVCTNLMSLVEGARKSRAGDLEHLSRSVEMQPDVPEPYDLTVRARTLTSILQEADVTDIDLLSLDVEGYELEALKGLDLRQYRPRYMLIETNFREEIERFMDVHHYEPVESLSHHDVLYRRL